MNWHEIDRPRERFWRAVADHLPRSLVYWAAVRVFKAAHEDPRYRTTIDALDIPATDAIAVWGVR